jgi:hypothetical protein
MDPSFYRELECNLSAPYIKGLKKVYAPRLEAGTVYATTYENLPTPPVDPEFDNTIYIGRAYDATSLVIGPDQVPPLAEEIVCGIIEMVTISSTSAGWYRGFIRGTSGQLSVSNLESAPINFNQRITTSNLDTILIDLQAPIQNVQWKITIYNRVFR